jgi:hypothetical protein
MDRKEGGSGAQKRRALASRHPRKRLHTCLWRDVTWRMRERRNKTAKSRKCLKWSVRTPKSLEEYTQYLWPDRAQICKLEYVFTYHAWQNARNTAATMLQNILILFDTKMEYFRTRERNKGI